MTDWMGPAYAKVGDGYHAIEKVAEDLILAIHGDKERALGDTLLKRPGSIRREILRFTAGPA
jgi:hypothetical protein